MKQNSYNKWLIVGLVVAVVISAGASQAYAHKPIRHLLLGWGGWGCDPCARPLWRVCCDPCCDYGWYRTGGLVYRPGLFGHRWVARGWVSCDPCVSDCCDEGTPVAIQPDQPFEPKLAPAKPVPPPPGVAEPPAGTAPGPRQPGTPPPPPGGMDDLKSPPPPLFMPGEKPGPGVSPPAGATPRAKTTSLHNGTMLLTVEVPAEAKVLINGHATQSTGTVRNYVSYGLKEGNLCPYTVTVLVPREGGEAIQLAKTVYAKAGDDHRLAFLDDLKSDFRLADAAGVR